MIIGLCGKKGVGKNFAADRIESICHRVWPHKTVEKGAFADALKETCSNLLGLESKQLYGSDADKNTKTQFSWSQMPEFILKNNPGQSGVMSVRQVLQVFGTDIMRDIWDKNVWINTLGRRVKASTADFFLVTDVRFPNEVEAIQSWGGEAWLIDGPQRIEAGKKNDTHVSERILESGAKFDRVIKNDISADMTILEFQLFEILNEAHRFSHGAL
jgi:hypothetical protein